MAVQISETLDFSLGSSASTSSEETEVIPMEVNYIEPQSKVLLHLFTNRHLRLGDNTALYQALQQNPDKFYTVYILEGMDAAAVAPIRWKFMIDCMTDLQDQLAEFGLDVYFLRGESLSILGTLINQWKITHISINMDPDINFRSYNEKISSICNENQIQLFTDMQSHRLLWLPSNYKSVITMENFRILLAGAITAKQNHSESEAKIQDVTPHLYREQLINLGQKVRIPCPFESSIPQLVDLFPADVLEKLTFRFKGGEQYVDTHFIEEYKEARLRQVETEEISSIFSKAVPISPYLRFGCITPRKCFKLLVELLDNPNYSREKIHSVLAGLVARDFALQAAQSQMIPERLISYNKLALPIPWDKNSDLIKLFTRAQTGFPFFDAAIIQLKTEGYAVNEVTEALATFATNGLLWISWEEGLELFYLNNVNFDLPFATHCWLEASASTFVSGKQKQYEDPLLFVSKKVDPSGQYIKRYIPQLANFPVEYIHKPELAPLELQTAANCIIGVDYPKPIFEYTCRNDICCKRMQVFMELVDKAAHAQVLPYVVDSCKGQFNN